MVVEVIPRAVFALKSRMMRRSYIHFTIGRLGVVAAMPAFPSKA